MTHPSGSPSDQESGAVWLTESAETPTVLSMVIPTRNEAPNITLLLSKLTAALRGLAVEIIFVDDSDDGTPATVRQVASRYPFAIGLIARPPHRRANGLGGAVLEGFRIARSPWMCVMDADLQHPPTTVRQLWEEAHRSGADLVMGTRLKGDGDTHGLSLHRNFVSRLLALTTRLTFPMRLWRVSDPLTGLFMLRNGAVDLDILEPDGFKILLEILVRSPRLKLAEVPFRFDYRHAGESKASVTELRRLLRHYARLRFSADIYLVRYVGVGLLSLLLNMLTLWLSTEQIGWHYLWGVVLATQISSLFSFALNERLVFDDRRQRSTRLFRFNGFMLLNNLLLPLLLPAIWLMVRHGVTSYLRANLVAVVALSLVRLIVSDQFLWQRQRNQPLNRSRPG
jgi:dolichol-phosphate mannosyltransferase